jgi:hypothetical protein
MQGLQSHQKVFGLGLSKTGTTSLAEALNILGIKTIHYPHDQETFDDLTNGNYRLSILEVYQGVADIPVAPYYAQLDQIYPESKFILTVRDKEPWLSSAEYEWRKREGRMNSDPQFREFTNFILACVYGSLQFSKDRFLYVYDTHVRNVNNYFKDREEDFLVMDICGGDGWQKLCRFLELPIPQTPFPHARAQVHANLIATPSRRAHALRLTSQDIAGLIREGETFIWVDECQLGDIDIHGRRVVPFLERNGRYWGRPPDDQTAIRELERLRRLGANFIVFGWPAFWWLKWYHGLGEHLRSGFPCVLENERLVAFDLRS